MKVNQVAQSVQTQQVQKKVRKQETTEVKQPNDKVEISTEARDLAQTSGIASTAKNSLDNVSGVRTEKIDEVREKIKEGFYNQDNVSSALADNLLKQFGI